MTGVLRRTVVWRLTFQQPVAKTSWLWRWPLHGLSKRQSPATVLLRIPVTQMIFFNQSNLLLCNDSCLTKLRGVSRHLSEEECHAILAQPQHDRSRWVGACNSTIFLSRRFHPPLYETAFLSQKKRCTKNRSVCKMPWHIGLSMKVACSYSSGPEYD